MHPPNEPDWAAAASQSGLTQLNQAILRMNESLDLDDVLQKALCGAVSLTGARHAAITLLDQSGEIHDRRHFDATVAGMELTHDQGEWTELLQRLGAVQGAGPARIHGIAGIRTGSPAAGATSRSTPYGGASGPSR